MADTTAGRLLTEAHRRSQLKIRAGAIAELLAIWPAFDFDDIDGSWPVLEASLIPLVLRRRAQSVETAANYYRTFRNAEGVDGPATPALPDEPNRLLMVATLRLLGPIQAKKNIAAGVRDPASRTLTRLSGTVSRQVLSGGRETLIGSIESDPAAKGWRRITDSKPCPFCARLAGAVVSAAKRDFQAHDHCGCSAEPAFK